MATTVNDAIRVNIRALREARGWSQSQLSARLRATGLCTWSPSVVALVEGGRQRADRIIDAAALCAVFGITLGELIHTNEPVQGADTVPPGVIALAIEGKALPPNLAALPDDAPHDLDRIARLMGLDRNQFTMLLYDVFQVYSFTALRDRRAGLVASHQHTDKESTTRARRGHATRSILAELQARLDRDGIEAVVARAGVRLMEENRRSRKHDREQLAGEWALADRVYDNELDEALDGHDPENNQ